MKSSGTVKSDLKEMLIRQDEMFVIVLNAKIKNKAPIAQIEAFKNMRDAILDYLVESVSSAKVEKQGMERSVNVLYHQYCCIMGAFLL